MELLAIYTKTPRGVSEVKNRAARLPRSLLNVLTTVDGKSSLEYLLHASKLSEMKFQEAIRQLEDEGFIKVVAKRSPSADAPNPPNHAIPPRKAPVEGLDELDFTAITRNALAEKGEGMTDTEIRVVARSMTSRLAQTNGAAHRVPDGDAEPELVASQAARTQAATEAKSRTDAEARAKAEAQAKAEAEAQARLAAQAEARAKAETRARLEAHMKAEAEKKARAEAERRADEERRVRETLEARLEAEKQAREEGEKRAREEADRRAREEADRKAKEEAERKTREETERRAREETERKAKEEAERRAKEEAQRKEKEEAERKARDEAEQKAREEMEAKLAAERTAREELEARLAAERKAKEEAERKARDEAERKAREEMEAKLAAERTAREELEVRLAAERKAKEEAEHRAREEAACKAKEEADRRATEEAQRKEKEEAERKAREELEARLAAERKAKEEAEHRAKEEAERRARQEAESKAKEEAERRAREEAERKAKEEAERRAKEEAQRKEKEEAERKARAELEAKLAAERKAKEEAERRAKEEAERRARQEAESKAKEEAERRAREETERRNKEEAERRAREEAQRREKEEAERKAHEELEAKLAAEREEKEEAERRAKGQEERNARQERERAASAGSNQAAPEAAPAAHEEVEGEDGQNDTAVLASPEAAARKPQDGAAESNDPVYAGAAADGIPNGNSSTAANLTSANELGDVSSLFEIDLEALDLQERQLRAQEEQERKLEAERHTRELAAREEAERSAKERAEVLAREAEKTAREAVEEAEQKAQEEERKLREAEELRRQEATARKAREEKEQQIREEAERRDREEAAARERAEAERKAKEKEDKRRAKEEEKARKQEEAEAKSRAKAIAKAEAKRDGRASSKQSNKKLKHVTIYAAVVAAVAVGLVHVVPFDGYAPRVESAVAERLGEPVKVGSVRFALLPHPQIKLEGITVGKGQDVKVGSAQAMPELGSLFSDRVVLSNIELQGVSADQEVIRRLAGWAQPGRGKALQVSRISFKEAKIATRPVALPPFEGEVTLGADGALKTAALRSQDGKFSLNLRSKPDGMEVAFTGRGWKPPIGPEIEFEEIHGKAMATGTAMTTNELSARLYGGTATGNATLSWAGPWTLAGEFSARELDFAAAVKPFTGQFRASGRLETSGRYTLHAETLDRLFGEPHVEGTFKAERGELDNVDLTRALQQAAATNPVRGGKTQFAEFSGTMNVSGNNYQYRQLALSSGILRASGSTDLVPSGDLSGRLNVELAAKPNAIRAVVAVSGKVADPQLKASR